MNSDWDVYEQGSKALKEGHYARAAVTLKPLKDKEPENAMLLEALGRSYLHLGLRMLAARAFEQILDLYPLDPYAHHCLARAYEGMGDRWQPRAARHYSLAVALDPRNLHFRLRRDLHRWGLSGPHFL